MLHNDKDIRELCLDIDKILINGDRFNDKVASLEDLQNRLARKAKFKEINFQEKCEGDNSLGELVLKNADENDNSCVKDFLLKKGFNLLEQEQVIATTEEEEKEEQNIPDIEEDKAGPSNKNEEDQFSTSYNKIREIVASNPNITAEEFSEELKKEAIDIRITNQDSWTLSYYAVRSEGPGIIGDRCIFLKTVELLINLNIGIDFKDTASRTVLDTAAINKQADIVKILLDRGKFNEKERFNALRLAIIQGNVPEAEAFLSYVNAESRQAALELAMNNTQGEITQVLLDFITSEISNVEENRAKPCSSNENIGNRSIATVPPINTDGDNHNNKNETPVSTRTSPTTTPNNNDKETKYKKSKKDFYTSLKSDAVGVIVTGLFIAAAVMVPSIVGATICGIAATLIAIATGLHVKNSTLPSYREMKENEVEHINPSMQTL